jgi:hypothetical protein
MSNTTNGTITLKSFAELASAFDVSANSGAAAGQPCPDNSQALAAPGTDNSERPLSDVVAQLAAIGSDLEAIARDDARAREQATVDLAQYEAILAERQEADHALTEARRLRELAEQLATEAFGDITRAQASHHLATARAAELRCTHVLAERTRLAQELASRPHVARALAERRRLADEQHEAAMSQEADRAARITQGLAEVEAAVRADQLERAQALVDSLIAEFPQDQQVRVKADVVRWRVRQRLVAPAEEALQAITRRPCRGNPEAIVTRLAAVSIDGLPEDLARRVFGLWSNACAQAVAQRGWHEPHRDAAATSRGIVFARPTPDAPYQVVSVLGVTDWKPGDVVDDERILRRARALELRASRS